MTAGNSLEVQGTYETRHTIATKALWVKIHAPIERATKDAATSRSGQARI